ERSHLIARGVPKLGTKGIEDRVTELIAGNVRALAGVHRRPTGRIVKEVEPSAIVIDVQVNPLIEPYLQHRTWLPARPRRQQASPEVRPTAQGFRRNPIPKGSRSGLVSLKARRASEYADRKQRLGKLRRRAINELGRRHRVVFPNKNPRS